MNILNLFNSKTEKRKNEYYEVLFTSGNYLSYFENERQMQNKSRFPDKENKQLFKVLIRNYHQNRVDKEEYLKEILDYYNNVLFYEKWKYKIYFGYLTIGAIVNQIFLSRTTSKFIKGSVILCSLGISYFKVVHKRHLLMEEFLLNTYKYEPRHIQNAISTRDYRYFLV